MSDRPPSSQLMRVRLEGARSPARPEGDPARGYVIVAPLDADGRLDAAAWSERRTACTVRRFLPGEPDRRGWIAHRAGGAGGSHWAIDFDAAREDDDQSGYRLGDHRFAPGEYVSIADEDGELQTYRVVTVEPA